MNGATMAFMKLKLLITRINKIIHGQRGIGGGTALRLARYFGMSAEFWTGIQIHYEVEMAKMVLADRLEKEVTIFATA